MSQKLNFYEVYRELFRRIDKEEEMEEQVGHDHVDAPTFGDAGSHSQDVLDFYKHWEIFGTLKEFTYVDKYSTKDGKNARERRFIQTENKKERQQEKKKFNQMVRDVLEFVRKRDTRYHDYINAIEAQKKMKKELEAEKKRKAQEEHEKKREEYREEMRKQYEEMDEQAEEEVIFENSII
jgi:DnaJ family protein A protein 5